jgi:prepilin-type N-terminal cleavage/methylation domain-containing protein
MIGKRQNKRGFTFLELMIVSLLIAVIAGIAVPAYMTVKYHAHEAKALSNLYSISKGHKLYWSEEPVDGLWAPPLIADLSPNYVQISIDDGNWDYIMTGSTGTAGGADPTFTAEARHKLPDGSQDGWIIQIDQSGSITHTNRPY